MSGNQPGYLGRTWFFGGSAGISTPAQLTTGLSVSNFRDYTQPGVTISGWVVTVPVGVGGGVTADVIIGLPGFGYESFLGAGRQYGWAPGVVLGAVYDGDNNRIGFQTGIGLGVEAVRTATSLLPGTDVTFTYDNGNVFTLKQLNELKSLESAFGSSFVDPVGKALSEIGWSGGLADKTDSSRTTVPPAGYFDELGNFVKDPGAENSQPNSGTQVKGWSSDDAYRDETESLNTTWQAAEAAKVGGPANNETDSANDAYQDQAATTTTATVIRTRLPKALPEALSRTAASRERVGMASAGRRRLPTKPNPPTTPGRRSAATTISAMAIPTEPRNRTSTTGA